MANLIEKKQTTLLDLNLDVLLEIFNKLEGNADKISLAMTHPHLTEAFVCHGRLQFQEIDFDNFNLPEEEKLFIFKSWGVHVQQIDNFRISYTVELQFIPDYFPNVKRLHIAMVRNLNIPRHFNEIAAILTTLPVETLDITFLEIYSLFELLRNCKTLTKLILYKSLNITIETIRTILDILDDNGFKPAKPFSLVVSDFSSVDDNLLTEISKCEKSNLLNIRRERVNFFHKLKENNDTHDETYKNLIVFKELFKVMELLFND